jgi:uncharacterized protein (TIGR02391 family)
MMGNSQIALNIEHRIQDTILEVFGSNSTEWKRYHDFAFCREFSFGPSYGQTDRPDRLAQNLQALVRAHTIVQGLITNLIEKKAEFTKDDKRGVKGAFKGLSLHPRIAAACANLFNNGHYRNAVFDASVALVDMVKEKSQRHDLDGADLMRSVFSKNNPILMMNKLKTQSDRDEQEGFMHLFEGAVIGLRNPRAHSLVEDRPETALEFIGLLSLLAKLVDKSRRPTP